MRLSTKDGLVQIGRFITHVILFLATLWFLDRKGYFFDSGDNLGYWLVFTAVFVLIVAWDDLFLAFISHVVMPEPLSTGENQRARFFRLFYKSVLLLLVLLILERFDHIPVIERSGSYWAGFAVFVFLVAAWYEVSVSKPGRRFLVSNFCERATLMGISLVLSLIGMELFLHTDYSRYHVFGFWPPPGQHLANLFVDPELRFETNSAGFRDIEHRIEKEPDVVRILILGDSFTAGQGVSQTEAYPAVLRELAGPSFEIIVAARPGVSTADELGFLKTYGCQFAPDVVLVGAISNDPDLPGPPDYQLDQKIFAELMGGRAPHMAYLLDYYINRLADQAGWRYSYTDWEDDLFDTSKPWFGEWEEVVADLAIEAEECGAAHRYAVLLPLQVPYQRSEIRANYERKYDILNEVFDRAGFDTVNLLPVYLAEYGNVPPRSLWALPNDSHPGSEIHRWYAEQIWAYLEPRLVSDD